MQQLVARVCPWISLTSSLPWNSFSCAKGVLLVHCKGRLGGTTCNVFCCDFAAQWFSPQNCIKNLSFPNPYFFFATKCGLLMFCCQGNRQSIVMGRGSTRVRRWVQLSNLGRMSPGAWKHAAFLFTSNPRIITVVNRCTLPRSQILWRRISVG